MTFPSVSLTIFLILIPGFVFVLMLRKFLPNKKIEGFYIGMYSIIWGILCYLILEVFSKTTLDFWSLIGTNTDAAITLNWMEIALTTVISLIASTIYLAIASRNLEFEFLNFIGATDMLSDRDGFSSFLSETKTVMINDFDSGLVYFGNVEALSSNDKGKEVVLRNCTIFKADETTGAFIEAGPAMQTQYLFFPNDKKISIMNASKAQYTDLELLGNANSRDDLDEEVESDEDELELKEPIKAKINEQKKK